MTTNEKSAAPHSADGQPIREIVLGLVFGALAPYLWLSAVSMSAGLVQAPFLETIGSDLDPALVKTWILFYFFLIGFLCSFISAAVVGLPLGYLLHGMHKLAWLIFALAFLAVSVGPGLWQRDLEGVASFFKSYEMWVFLLGSLLFVYVGKRWRARRLAKSSA